MLSTVGVTTNKSSPLQQQGQSGGSVASTLFNAVHSARRLRTLRETVFAVAAPHGGPPIDAFMLVAGIDSRDDGVNAAMLNYLLTGNVERTLKNVAGTGTADALDDVMIVLYRDTGVTVVYATPQAASLLCPLTSLWPLTRLIIQPLPHFEDAAKFEEHKMLWFRRLADESAVGIGMVMSPRKPSASTTTAQKSSSDTANPKDIVEAWPIVQSYAVDAQGGRPFFTLAHSVVDVTSRCRAMTDPLSASFALADSFDVLSTWMSAVPNIKQQFEAVLHWCEQHVRLVAVGGPHATAPATGSASHSPLLALTPAKLAETFREFLGVYTNYARINALADDVSVIATTDIAPASLPVATFAAAAYGVSTSWDDSTGLVSVDFADPAGRLRLSRTYGVASHAPAVQSLCYFIDAFRSSVDTAIAQLAIPTCRQSTASFMTAVLAVSVASSAAATLMTRLRTLATMEAAAADGEHGDTTTSLISRAVDACGDGEAFVDVQVVHLGGPYVAIRGSLNGTVLCHGDTFAVTIIAGEMAPRCCCLTQDVEGGDWISSDCRTVQQHQRVVDHLLAVASTPPRQRADLPRGGGDASLLGPLKGFLDEFTMAEGCCFVIDGPASPSPTSVASQATVYFFSNGFVVRHKRYGIIGPIYFENTSAAAGGSKPASTTTGGSSGGGASDGGGSRSSSVSSSTPASSTTSTTTKTSSRWWGVASAVNLEVIDPPGTGSLMALRWVHRPSPFFSAGVANGSDLVEGDSLSGNGIASFPFTSPTHTLAIVFRPSTSSRTSFRTTVLPSWQKAHGRSLSVAAGDPSMVATWERATSPPATTLPVFQAASRADGFAGGLLAGSGARANAAPTDEDPESQRHRYHMVLIEHIRERQPSVLRVCAALDQVGGADTEQQMPSDALGAAPVAQQQGAASSSGASRGHSKVPVVLHLVSGIPGCGRHKVVSAIAEAMARQVPKSVRVVVSQDSLPPSAHWGIVDGSRFVRDETARVASEVSNNAAVAQASSAASSAAASSFVWIFSVPHFMPVGDAVTAILSAVSSAAVSPLMRVVVASSTAVMSPDSFYDNLYVQPPDHVAHGVWAAMTPGYVDSLCFVSSPGQQGSSSTTPGGAPRWGAATLPRVERFVKRAFSGLRDDDGVAFLFEAPKRTSSSRFADPSAAASTMRSISASAPLGIVYSIEELVRYRFVEDDFGWRAGLTDAAPPPRMSHPGLHLARRMLSSVSPTTSTSANTSTGGGLSVWSPSFWKIEFRSVAVEPFVLEFLNHLGDPPASSPFADIYRVKGELQIDGRTYELTAVRNKPGLGRLKTRGAAGGRQGNAIRDSSNLTSAQQCFYVSGYFDSKDTAIRRDMHRFALRSISQTVDTASGETGPYSPAPEVSSQPPPSTGGAAAATAATSLPATSVSVLQARVGAMTRGSLSDADIRGIVLDAERRDVPLPTGWVFDADTAGYRNISTDAVRAVRPDADDLVHAFIDEHNRRMKVHL